ncbi:unnamed protein product, partial [Thelazia callipaeda]|uniref:Ground-like domain-containing protein n=1 Tax=Thelazia callipaeda TaxID=103827 RepID=A0A0N5D5Q0_THECL
IVVSISFKKIVLLKNFQNLSPDPKISKAAIYSELKAKHLDNYVVLCSQSNLSFTADSTNYCVDGSLNQTCYVFQL